MEPNEPNTQISTVYILIFYGLLCCAAWGWAYFDTGSAYIQLAVWNESLALSLFSALAFAISIIALTPRILRSSEPMRILAVEIQALLGPLPRHKILFLAIASGFAEELFFRGAMQSSLGILVTSLIFGLLHGFPGTRFFHWGVFAFVAGLGFGLLQEASSSVLAPALAHIAINYLNLCRIVEGKLDHLTGNLGSPPDSG